MKIVVITGSPHKNGNTNLLVDEFIKGASKKSHEIYRFDSAFKKIHPCIGCDKCECGTNECVFKDDMLELYPKLIEADIVVFATPIYYHTYSAQLKDVIDRFHGVDNLIKGNKKAILIAVGANPNLWITEGLYATFKTNLKWLEWNEAGHLFAYGCQSIDDIRNTDYLKEAHNLGASL